MLNEFYNMAKLSLAKQFSHYGGVGGEKQRKTQASYFISERLRVK